MDNESLIRLCVTAFTEEEISKAKMLLYDSVTTKKRNISRRKDGKAQRELEDIICLFKETDAESFPVFVARELHKLPPVTFDHIDATRVLKDLVILQEEIKLIKSNYVTKEMLQVHTVDMASPKCQSSPSDRSPQPPPASCFKNVNKRRGASNANISICLDSGLEGLLHMVNNKNTTHSEGEGGGATISSQLTCEGAPPGRQPLRPVPELVSTNRGSDGVCPVATMADVVRKEGDWKRRESLEEWTEVRRRRYRNRFEGKTGKAPSEQNCKFRAAETKVPLFISNVHKDTTEKDIIDYIHSNTQEVVQLEKINMKIDKGYNSYKVWVSKCKRNLYLNDTLWPEGISFRNFIYFRHSIAANSVPLQT
ncbi:uncharacterized protein LOC123875311 [Maniola jurtina]|uniref:uncharacterized protein LOC123875311 n=1 Tax=Maniola jurtina TaxID=191418 RepID=UPI001E686986|nr:uncharacterized protein LOC123875311 [Maniola jurtina]